jgi:hypothetical protein
MFTVSDLATHYSVDERTVCLWYARRVLPEPVKVNDQFRWREDDITLFDEYLRQRAECRADGLDPDSPDGPAPPVYSQGLPTVDPRECMAQVREQERQERSKVLGKTIANAKPAEMPEVKTQDEVPAE